MHRFYITGTDTDVGKTRVSAALAKALHRGHEETTIVKIVQTGIAAGLPGDAELAASLAGCAAVELRRFEKPSDPWTAALAASADPLDARELSARLNAIPGSIVAEGSGGAAVPLNVAETITDVARHCDLQGILVVGLRLGCINHALMTLEYLRKREIVVRGAVLCERWPSGDREYAEAVGRVLGHHCEVLGLVRFETDAQTCVDRASHIFESSGKG